MSSEVRKSSTGEVCSEISAISAFCVQRTNSAVKALQVGQGRCRGHSLSLRNYIIFFWARTLEPRSLRSEYRFRFRMALLHSSAPCRAPINPQVKMSWPDR